MACPSFTFRETLVINFICILLISVAPILRIACELSSCEPPFKSIISFGDSLADTGNKLRLSNNNPPVCALPPYGQTYFHAQTGRFSDGRLIIDFLAQYLGLPLVPPSIGSKIGSFYAGVNFAFAGATALNKPISDEGGVYIPVWNCSLGTQLSWFKDLLPSLCQTSADCDELFERSLFVVGEIGGNDYKDALIAGVSVEVVETFVSPVVDAIVSTVNELLYMGAKTLHNTALKTALARLQESHPHANIIYADYYNAAMQLFVNPSKFGFSKGATTACCGANGPYHFNISAICGKPLTTVCEDSSLYVNWDGLHLTEAAYSFMFQDLFQGPYTIPPFSSLCTAASRPQYL